ncbi:MAG TPA: protein kinase [Thermoanaerobaculia bacterium]|nr:protein kinase [Thermoanaerobaculia bacterium]
MPLEVGSRLGPYEILSPLGAGGMGEVYRARDARLKRDVAVKVLPSAFAADAERLRRFEQEAQAASALNHPNILSIYDLGTNESDGAPYIVSELLEGETLRVRLSGGAFTARRAIGYAIPMAKGLAAAHEKGIVHRDLKPENVFVTNDERVKILDFGVAKLTQPEGRNSSATNLPTVPLGTEPGVVMGTLGYMSPEQVRGRAADARSDIFSFGAILYEMLSGRRAFQGDTAADAISAILTREPADLSEANRKIPETLDRIVRHCLEKSPEARFHSASDVAFDLEAITGTSGAGALSADLPRRGARVLWWPFAAAASALLVVAAGMLLERTFRKPELPTYRQLTFRRGRVDNARFGPDGQSIVYGATFGGDPPRVFSVRPESPESSPLALPMALLFSISRTGELAVGVRPSWSAPATLARAPLSGGAPREVLNDVTSADWSPGGEDLAVSHVVGGKERLEFPIGKVLYESRGWIEDVRVSPDGTLVALADHPVSGDTTGSVIVVDRAGKVRTLSAGWYDLSSVNWAPSGREVWFSATTSGVRDRLWAVTLSGKRRLVAEGPGGLLLYAISRSGQAVVGHSTFRNEIAGVPPGETEERDVSWLDFSFPVDLSEDGRTLLFEEWGEAGGSSGAVYVRHFDGTAPVHLGSGLALALSPDARWVLSLTYTEPRQLVLLPTAAGQPRPLPGGERLNLHYQEWGQFLPNGKAFLFRAAEPGRKQRLYIQDLDGGAPRPVAGEGTLGATLGGGGSLAEHTVSPDGRWIAAVDSDWRIRILSLSGGEKSRPIPGVEAGERPIRWSGDGRRLYVGSFNGTTGKVFRVDVATGQRELWREFHPDPAGLLPRNVALVLTGDGKTYFVGYQRRLTELYLVEGLR